MSSGLRTEKNQEPGCLLLSAPVLFFLGSASSTHQLCYFEKDNSFPEYLFLYSLSKHQVKSPQQILNDTKT